MPTSVENFIKKSFDNKLNINCVSLKLDMRGPRLIQLLESEKEVEIQKGQKNDWLK